MGILYLTRHGETEWNREWRLQGKKDSALTSKGIWQAERLGNHLETIPLQKIYSSSSPRAVHTAQCIRGNRSIPIETLESLMEIGLGSWEGQKADDLKVNYPIAFDAFWNYPDKYVPASVEGETFQMVQERMRKTIDELMLKHPEETVLIVTHGISLKLLLASLENRSIATLFHDEMAHSAGLTRIDFSPDHYAIAFKNAINFQGQWDENVG